MFKATLIAGAGGFVGTCFRYLFVRLGALIYPGGFPLGTFMANLLGCLLIGVFYGWATKRQWFSQQHSLFLIIGLCGGFTTFSSFSDELLSLINAGDIATFLFYLGISLIMGLLAVSAGIALVRQKENKTAKTR